MKVGKWECRFVVGSLGRAASPRPPHWANKVGVEPWIVGLGCFNRPRRRHVEDTATLTYAK